MAAHDASRNEVPDFLRGERLVVARVRGAIEAAVRRFGPASPAEQQLLVQEALGRVFLAVSAGRYRGEASLVTFAGVVAKYTCVEQFRRRRPVDPVDPDELPSAERWASPEGSLLRDEEQHLRLKAVAGLGDECRELFRMIFVDRLPYREIATRLGISEGGVKTRTHRCRRAARRLLAESTKPSGLPDHYRKGKP